VEVLGLHTTLQVLELLRLNKGQLNFTARVDVLTGPGTQWTENIAIRIGTEAVRKISELTEVVREGNNTRTKQLREDPFSYRLHVLSCCNAIIAHFNAR